MISETDVILAISFSGETKEILDLLPSIKKMNIDIISITGNKNSTLAKASNIHIHIKIDREACPLNLPQPLVQLQHYQLETHWPQH